MRKTSAIPIRLDRKHKESLDRIAEATGISVSTLVRMLVQSFVDAYDQSGGRVAIPPQWKHHNCEYVDIVQNLEYPTYRKVAESGAEPKPQG